jgi:hypothetical protein
MFTWGELGNTMTRTTRHLWPWPDYGPLPTVGLWCACATTGTVLYISDRSDPASGTGRILLAATMLTGVAAMGRTFVRGSRQRTADVVAELKRHERREEAAIDVGLLDVVEHLAEDGRLLGMADGPPRRVEAPPRATDRLASATQLASVHAINGTRRQAS